MKKKFFCILCAIAIMLTSAVPVMAAVTVDEPYTFEMWCADNGLLNQKSSNDVPTFESLWWSYDPNSIYFVRSSSSSVVCYKVEDKGQFFWIEDNTVYCSASHPGSFHYTYMYDQDGWRYSSGVSESDGHIFSFDNSSIVYSSVDIYSDKEQSSIFFPRTPLPELNLQKVVEETDLTLTMAELIGVLPLVIGLVVSCLGLRKGWRVLAVALHRA